MVVDDDDDDDDRDRDNGDDDDEDDDDDDAFLLAAEAYDDCRSHADDRSFAAPAFSSRSPAAAAAAVHAWTSPGTPIDPRQDGNAYISPIKPVGIASRGGKDDQRDPRFPQFDMEKGKT
jgi:hypothetical protein